MSDDPKLTAIDENGIERSRVDRDGISSDFEFERANAMHPPKGAPEHHIDANHRYWLPDGLALDEVLRSYDALLRKVYAARPTNEGTE